MPARYVNGALPRLPHRREDKYSRENFYKMFEATLDHRAMVTISMMRAPLKQFSIWSIENG